MATTAPSSNLPDSDTASNSIDGRRAQQLIERSMSLAERNDLPAAVLACRQATALAPESPAGFSMLGLLLERAGDGAGAITAYEKVLQLAPDSLLERESLGRLRVSATRRSNTRDQFMFDDAELFSDERPEETPTAAAGGMLAPTGSASPGSASPEKPEMSAAPNATPNAQAAIAADAAARAATAPLAAAAHAAPAKAASASGAAMPFPSTLPAPSGSAGRLPPVAPANLDWPVQAPTLSQKLKQHPSFYFRGAPVAVASVLSLGVLLWAHSYASSRSAVEVAPGANSRNGATTAMNPTGDVVSNTNNNTNANPGAPDVADGGVIPVNPTSSPSATTVAGTGAAPNGGTPAASTPATASRPATPTRPATGAVPTNPSTPAAASTPAAPRTPAASGNDEIYPRMPPPRLGAPATPDDTVRIAPSGGSTSSGGAPVDPSGARDRGYVRVNPGATRAPARPENTAAGNESAAGGSARAGDSAAAISRMTRSIESGGGDTAFRYQQRAGLYVQSGDYSRAINDYQSAIAAYNDMIARGERVSFARSGIQASQRGIQLAQSRR